jgi:hypothetical protein
MIFPTFDVSRFVVHGSQSVKTHNDDNRRDFKTFQIVTNEFYDIFSQAKIDHFQFEFVVFNFGDGKKLFRLVFTFN